MIPNFDIKSLLRSGRELLYGPDEEKPLTIWYLILGSVILSAVFVGTRGSLFSGLAFIGIVVVLILTFYRVEWGFYIFIGMVMSFDQFMQGEFIGSRTVFGVEYFQNLKSLPSLSSVGFAVLTPMEVHLFLIIIVWLLLIAFKKRVMLNRVPVAPAAIIFFLWLAFSFANGLRRGGDFLTGLWEIRALGYMGVVYFFVPQIIQTGKQVRALMWVCIAAISFKAAMACLRFASVGFTMEGYSAMTCHEDPLFFISLFILFLGLVMFRYKDAQRTTIFWLLLPLLVGYVVAQRRAAFGSLVIGVAAMVILLPRKQQMSFMKVFSPAILVFALYLVVFWDSESNSAIARPAIFIRSSFYTSEAEAADSYTSNLYRAIEDYDLAFTARREPLTGIGFGVKYDQPISLPDIPFPLKDYIPHNTILWLLAKTGAIGFLLFCFFLTAFVYQAASVFARLQNPYLKMICIVSIAGVLGQLVVSYYDLQLTFYRNMTYLGMLMGLLPALELADQEPESVEEYRDSRYEFVNSPL